ncbi:MAG: hypothetical protein ACLPX5_07945 [Dissulfurispiraceae bacterium]
MNTIYTYEKKDDVVAGNNSGLFLASDPFSYTASVSHGLIISGIWSVLEDIDVLDNLSDEIGVVHESVEGEVVENNTDE